MSQQGRIADFFNFFCMRFENKDACPNKSLQQNEAVQKTIVKLQENEKNCSLCIHSAFNFHICFDASFLECFVTLLMHIEKYKSYSCFKISFNSSITPQNTQENTRVDNAASSTKHKCCPFTVH